MIEDRRNYSLEIVMGTKCLMEEFVRLSELNIFIGRVSFHKTNVCTLIVLS